MNKIELSNISKIYGKVKAVDRLDLSIREGEFLTLLGPSGCGKTTTLRMIAGLEEPTEGEIRAQNTILYSKKKGVYTPPERRAMGFMFQSYALWPHMNVFKNISLGLESQKLAKSEIDSRVKKVLAQVQMSDYGSRYPSELSGGQQQRVALARMIASQTDIFLMDEPLSNLDALLRIDMRSELKHLHQTLHSTTIYVTHDQIEALTLSDRIVVMNNGVIMQLDSPEKIYHKPKNLFVAKFVGNPPINLLRGVVRKDSPHPYSFVADDVSIDVSKVDGAESIQENNEVFLGVRAEHLHITEKTEGDGIIPFDVYAVLPSGSETIITARRGNSYIMIKEPGFFSSSKVNQKIGIEFDQKEILFFDVNTEQLLN
ncbi:MAG: ABC transporter ATP-binding protein [Sphaerochaetaceae bacterium]|nr:ABC transporter ATP-binding protein [Sphaerochaetaceae bacterium]